jgi:mRNA-degrading endonuclease RelE of RelBE toxin-antitoxin system
MAVYQVVVTEEAKADLTHYTAFERKIITTAMRTNLPQLPSRETKNQKQLRDNPIASWELRAGRYRIFYEVDEKAHYVIIIAVGHKEHNRLLIKGTEVRI